MDIVERVNNIFPMKSEIPAELWAGLPLTQEGYLVDGRVFRWTGPMQEVYSPAYVRTNGAPEPVRIGAYPLLTETESLQALEAAVAAYDHGRGAWPTMGVAERIHHMEQFVFRMIEQNDLNKGIITRIVRDHKSKFLATDFIL